MELKIPDSYLQEEEREGFVIAGMMKRSWATKLKMISAIDEILTDHGIRWFADYGTLLGAVRHRGFIPWDDDFDISLFREDYDRALTILEAELPANYKIGRFGRNQFDQPLSAINNRWYIDTGDDPKEAAITAEFYGNPYADIIDVFPLDYIPRDKEEREGLLIIYDVLMKAVKVGDGMRQVGLLSEYAEQIHALTGQEIPVDERFLPAVCGIMSMLGKMYTREDAVGIENLSNMTDHARNRWRQLAWYDHAVRLPFEMIRVPVPAGYRELLQANYGSAWMSPVKNSAGHGYPFYARQQRMIDKYKENRDKAGKHPLREDCDRC
ncbi:MAG: LicD family protein [Lachnospiraceae bacterium]|nr:LicD family protein [Lachnospiraceae bacterium]